MRFLRFYKCLSCSSHWKRHSQTIKQVLTREITIVTVFGYPILLNRNFSRFFLLSFRFDQRRYIKRLKKVFDIIFKHFQARQKYSAMSLFFNSPFPYLEMWSNTVCRVLCMTFCSCECLSSAETAKRKTAKFVPFGLF